MTVAWRYSEWVVTVQRGIVGKSKETACGFEMDVFWT